MDNETKSRTTITTDLSDHLKRQGMRLMKGMARTAVSLLPLAGFMGGMAVFQRHSSVEEQRNIDKQCIEDGLIGRSNRAACIKALLTPVKNHAGEVVGDIRMAKEALTGNEQMKHELEKTSEALRQKLMAPSQNFVPMPGGNDNKGQLKR